MHWKSVMENLFTVLGPLVEPSSKYIENSKVSIESSISIRQIPITLNSNRNDIPPSLHSSLFFISILRYNGRNHQSRGWQWNNVESYMCINYSICMANNGKDTTHTRHIARRMHFVSFGENFKMHKIDWCKWGLQLSDIATKNVGEPD